MKKEDIIIVGAGGHAQIVIDIIEKQGKYNIVALIAGSSEKKNNLFGYPIKIGDDQLELLFKQGITNIAIGIGGFRDNTVRIEVFERVKKIGFNLPPIVHPNAVLGKSVVIGEGSVVFAGVVLNPLVTIGINSIVATSSSVDHESNIGNHVLISAGVTIGAFATIGDCTLIALGAKVISGINISNNVLVAAGSVVVKNIEAHKIVFGIPAKEKKV